METETLKQRTEELTSHLSDYSETFLKLTMLNATQKGSTMASAAITNLLLGALVLFVLFFGALGVSWWLGNRIESRVGGFLIVAGFFLLLFFMGMMLRKKTIFPFLRNSIIKKVYE